ncbi:MAG: hypothetical protein ACR2GN_07455 [Bacteroidia bacterium]
MKNYLSILIVLSIASCGYPNKEENVKVETATIDSMHSFLTTLDLRLPESAGSALSYTQTIMQTMDEDRRDSAFILYRQFFYEVLIKQNEVLSQNEFIAGALAENKQDVEEVEYFRKKITDNGMVFLQSEGFFYIDEHHNYLHNAFSKFVSDPIKKLLEMRKEEMRKGFSEDGALLISFKEVGERLRNWEKLLEENPSLKLQDEGKGYYNLYFSTFLTGLDNTPAFNNQTQILVPEAQEAYEDYIKSYKETRSGEIVSAYYNMLQQNNFKKPEQLKNFLMENNITGMEGIQPPTR